MDNVHLEKDATKENTCESVTVKIKDAFWLEKKEVD